MNGYDFFEMDRLIRYDDEENRTTRSRETKVRVKIWKNEEL